MKNLGVLFVALLLIAGCTKKDEPTSGEPKPTPQQAGGAADAMPAGGMKEFSADIKTTMPNGPSSTGKMYVGNGKLRMEMNAGGQQSVMIVDTQAGKTWTLMPQQKMYMEMPQQQSEIAQMAKQPSGDDPCANIPNATCKRAGEENVNGRQTVKWEIAMDVNGQKSTITQWVDPSLPFVIRQQTSEGMTMDVTNVQQGAQPASLFEVPGDYKKLSVPNVPPPRE